MSVCHDTDVMFPVVNSLWGCRPNSSLVYCVVFVTCSCAVFLCSMHPYVELPMC